MLDTPKPHDWLIKRYFESDCLIQLIGEPEAGKSLLALEWAASIATGKAWRGNAVRQGSVIYLLGEGGNGFARRMKAWGLQNVPLGVEVPLLVSTRAAGLPSEVETVAEEVESFTFKYGEPALIVVDTLARSIEGDENSQKDMGAFITGCDILRERYHCAMLIVHHSGHGETKRARGSSSLPAAVDTSYLLTKKDKRRELSCQKSKDIEPPETLFFRIEGIPLPTDWKDADGSLITAPVLVADDGRGVNPNKRMTPAQQTGMESLGLVANENGCASLEAWRVKFYEMSTADSQSAKKKSFQRVRNELVAMGELSVENDRYSKPNSLGWHSGTRDSSGTCPGS